MFFSKRQINSSAAWWHGNRIVSQTVLQVRTGQAAAASLVLECVEVAVMIKLGRGGRTAHSRCDEDKILKTGTVFEPEIILWNKIQTEKWKQKSFILGAKILKYYFSPQLLFKIF